MSKKQVVQKAGKDSIPSVNNFLTLPEYSELRDKAMSILTRFDELYDIKKTLDTHFLVYRDSKTRAKTSHNKLLRMDVKYRPDWITYSPRNKFNTLHNFQYLLNKILARILTDPEFAWGFSNCYDKKVKALIMEWDLSFPENVSEHHLAEVINPDVYKIIREYVKIHWVISGRRSIHAHIIFKEAKDSIELYPLLESFRYLIDGEFDKCNINHGLRLPLSHHQKNGNLCRYFNCLTADETLAYINGIVPDDVTLSNLYDMHYRIQHHLVESGIKQDTKKHLQDTKSYFASRDASLESIYGKYYGSDEMVFFGFVPGPGSGILKERGEEAEKRLDTVFNFAEDEIDRLCGIAHTSNWDTLLDHKKKSKVATRKSDWCKRHPQSEYYQSVYESNSIPEGTSYKLFVEQGADFALWLTHFLNSKEKAFEHCMNVFHVGARDKVTEISRRERIERAFGRVKYKRSENQEEYTLTDIDLYMIDCSSEYLKKKNPKLYGRAIQVFKHILVKVRKHGGTAFVSYDEICSSFNIPSKNTVRLIFKAICVEELGFIRHVSKGSYNACNAGEFKLIL